MFKLHFRPKALKILTTLERATQLEINSALDDLRAGKFVTQDIKKIQGTKNGYRLRLKRWRILFALFSTEKRVEIIDIFLKKGKGDYSKRKNLLR